MLAMEALPEPAVIADDTAEVGRRTPPVLLTREPLVVEAVVPVCCEEAISKGFSEVHDNFCTHGNVLGIAGVLIMLLLTRLDVLDLRNADDTGSIITLLALSGRELVETAPLATE